VGLTVRARDELEASLRAVAFERLRETFQDDPRFENLVWLNAGFGSWLNPLLDAHERGEVLPAGISEDGRIIGVPRRSGKEGVQ
jgi:hypothetical protein